MPSRRSILQDRVVSLIALWVFSPYETSREVVENVLGKTHFWPKSQARRGGFLCFSAHYLLPVVIAPTCTPGIALLGNLCFVRCVVHSLLAPL